nr:MAG: ORF1 [TTV-like mini virus]
MPYYWRRPNYYRRRRLWRRRFRPFVRRRFYRRRYYRKRFPVRKRKLKYLHLKEYQPERIRKLKITGVQPLYYCTHERVSNNMGLYIDSIAPHHVPGGGGFSILQFTLNALFELFTKARAWWTQSNNDYPLIRYTGCTIKLFKSESSDYIFSYRKCYPMKANLETYQGTHPTILQLSKHHRTIRCKKYNPYKKPYKTVKIGPPAQMQNKWVFQKDIANMPLVMFQTVACSLDRWFLPSSAMSTTIGFTTLNPDIFDLHNFEQPTTTGYHPKDNLFLFALENGHTTLESIEIQKLIYLGNSKALQPGITIEQFKNSLPSTQQTYNEVMTKYFSDAAHWGNPFMIKYLKQEVTILVSNLPPSELKTKFTMLNQRIKTEPLTITFLTNPLLRECRYNPLNDRGDQNEIFLIKILNDFTSITPPTDPSLKSENLPLWLATWGFIDFQKRANTIQKIDVNTLTVLHTKYIEPKDLKWIIPLDEDFLEQKSEYRPDDTPTEYDQEHWHPKTVFQLKTLNNIAASGPGTVKLPKGQSTEAHMKFNFYFKLGGCASETKDIENPEDQPKFPTPNNFANYTSLQSPEYPIQGFLYNFDWRRDFLTKKAEKRMQKYIAPEKPIFEPTGLNILTEQTSPTTSQETETSDEEKEEETLQLLIDQHRYKQLQFKRRILNLLKNLDSK